MMELTRRELVLVFVASMFLCIVAILGYTSSVARTLATQLGCDLVAAHYAGELVNLQAVALAKKEGTMQCGGNYRAKCPGHDMYPVRENVVAIVTRHGVDGTAWRDDHLPYYVVTTSSTCGTPRRSFTYTNDPRGIPGDD